MAGVSYVESKKENLLKRRRPMSDKVEFDTLSQVDLDAIERHARQLRAQALRDGIRSLKNLFARPVQILPTGGVKA